MWSRRTEVGRDAQGWSVATVMKVVAFQKYIYDRNVLISKTDETGGRAF